MVLKRSSACGFPFCTDLFLVQSKIGLNFETFPDFVKVYYLFAYGLFKKVTIMFKAWPPTPWAGHSFPIRHHFAIASGRTTKGRHT